MEQPTAQQPSLIQKDIKRHTNYGENYNRQSFYDTIDECMYYDESLDVSSVKTSDEDTMYLNQKRIEQEMKHIELYKRYQYDPEFHKGTNVLDTLNR